MINDKLKEISHITQWPDRYWAWKLHVITFIDKWLIHVVWIIHCQLAKCRYETKTTEIYFTTLHRIQISNLYHVDICCMSEIYLIINEYA